MEDMGPKAAVWQLLGDPWRRWDRSWRGASQLGPERGLLGVVVCALEQAEGNSGMALRSLRWAWEEFRAGLTPRGS